MPRSILSRSSAPARALAVVLAFIAGLGLHARSASAQTRTFYLDRAQISGAPDDGYMVWRPYVHERTRFYGMAAFGFTLNPLRNETVAQDGRNQQRMADPVDGQIISYLSIGTELAGRASLNASLPIALYQFIGEDPQRFGVGDGLNAANVATHDLRLDARVKAYESDNRKLRLGLGGAFWIKTGDPESYTSDDQSTGMLYGSAEYDFGKFFLTGMLGPHFRPNRSIGGAEGALFLGSELRYAVGAFIPMRDGKVRIGAELWGSTGLVTTDDGESSFFRGRNTDLEWLAQGRFAIGQEQRVWFMAGAGTRLATGYGAPDVRVLTSIGYWFPIKDSATQSPDRRIRVTSDVDEYAKDTDGDGYPDDIDKCPTVPEDGKPPDPSDGCPADSDRDGDGIPDSADACPDVPEDMDGVQDSDGCPEDDADNDGIPDAQDKCPLEPGPASKNAEKHGCPSLTRITEDGEVALLEPIQFEYNKATIKRESFPILDEIVTLMKSRPKMRIGVYGHTDNRGNAAYNLRLSKQRAASCLDYLASKGIARNRLESEGFGLTKPLTTNDTDEGRAKNRRVEFKILGE
ncbi:MAG: OmpA family protein [Polyangiaceae bacterium]|nr:OmpA family protein [Polyangiaceae bacterium]